MAGLISDIVGGNVDSDLDKLVAKLAAVEKELDVINGKAISIKVDLQGVGTLSELTNLYKQQDDILTKLRSTSVQYVDTYKMATEVIKQHNGHSKEFVAVSQGIAKTTLEEARARKENAKALLDEQKYIAALSKEKENLEKKTVKAQQAAEKESNAYLQLRKTYNEQSTALKGMIIQYGEADAAVLKMKADVDKMQLSLLKAEEAVGQHQRKVGQYQNATFALTQIIREAPAFAYGINVGIGALSNNLPQLIEQFQLLRATVGSTGTALKIFATSMFSISNIFTLAYTGLMLYTSGMFDFSKEADKAAKSGNDFNATLKGINEEARSTALIEIANTDKLFATSTDLNSAYSDRVAAIEKLISLYPELLGNLEREDFLTGNVAGKQKIQDIISYKSAIEARKKSIEEINKEISALKSNTGLDEDGLNKFGETYDPLDYTGSVFSTRSPKTEAEIKRLTSLKESFEFAKDSFEKSLADLTSTRHAGRIWMDIDNDIKQQERLVKTTVQGTKEHTKALSELKRYQEEMDVYMGKDKQGKTKMDEMQAAIKLEEELYKKHKIAIDAEYEKNRVLETESGAADINAKLREQANERQRQAAEIHSNKLLAILTKYHGKVGESEDMYKARQIQAQNDLDEVKNASNEKDKKIAEEKLKRHEEENRQIDEWIDKMKAAQFQLDKTYAEIDAIKEKAANNKEYADGVMPFFEGLGFDMSLKRNIKQRNVDIKRHTGTKAGLETDLAGEQALSDMGMGDGLKIVAIKQKIADEEKSIKELEVANENEYNQKIIEGKKELARKTIDLAKEAMSAINTIRNNAFAAEQQQLDIQTRNLKIQTEQQMRAIDAKAGFEASKANEKTILAAQTAAKENEIRSKYNQLALRQAIANKQAAQAEVISQTAVAIISTMASYAKLGPAGIALGIGLSAAIAGIGAAQYAAVSSAPLPQYAKGTEGTTAERFIAGEKGAELGVTPSGKTMLFEKEGIYSAPLGTKIKTADQTKKLMQYAINGIGYNGESLNALSQNMHISLDDKKIVDSIKEQTHDIAVTLWKTKGNNNSSTQQAYIDAVREQQNLISKFK